MTTTFHAPQSLIFGGGARQQLPGELLRLGLTKVLIVTDPYLQQSGRIAEFTDNLGKSGIQTEVFAGVQPDPTDQNVFAGLALLKDAQAIVAIGGGSPIDAAKIIAVAATNPGPLSAFQGYYRIPAPGLPVIAVPTTAGTGSEATKVAVLIDTTRNVKMMILDPKLMPCLSIVDYELSMTMPPALTAHVGVDTLTHGIEAYVSRKASGMTDPIAQSCIQLVARHLVNAWDDPENRVAREAMALAACQGGLAFTNSSVCLVHGMSRPMGAVFHLPHGLSNAVLLPEVTRFSLPGASSRYAQIARWMGFCDESKSDDYAGGALIHGLLQLNERVRIPRLRDCPGMESFDACLSKMAGDALASGSPQNNPVVPTAEQIIDLYRLSW